MPPDWGRGCDFDAEYVCLFLSLQSGATAIHTAAWLGLADIVAVLASSGADMTVTTTVFPESLVSFAAVTHYLLCYVVVDSFDHLLSISVVYLAAS